MKKLFKYAGIALCTILISSCNINVPDTKDESSEALTAKSTSTFKVWGNCEMCKETIEGALKVPGIAIADWDSETKQISVKYDSTVINLDGIQQKIAASGYDTEKYKADDEAYANLHECCQYERKP